MGLRVHDDSVTAHKSSDDDDLNESAATVQRPLPPPRVSRPAEPEANPFAAFENDDVEGDDEEGSLPTEALIRPELALAKAGIDLDDKAPTAVGHKKIRLPSSPMLPPEPDSKPRIPIIKTPMAMSISTLDEPAPVTLPLPPEPEPESGHTRIAPLQPTSAATASLRQAFQHPPIPAPPPKKTPSHKVALLVGAVLFAAAMVIVIMRSQHAQMVAAQQPPASVDAFPPAATAPVEVAPAPVSVPVTALPPATFQAPVPPPPPTATQAQPQVKPRRPVHTAVRPAIPVHREQ